MKRLLNALIVDDSEDDTQLMLREFEQGGFVVTHQRVETVEAFQAALNRETWDVLLCDYTMPQFSGREALQVAKESGLDLPFIFVSGTMGEEVVVEAMKAGAHDYVVKNSLRRLVPAAARALREAALHRQHETLKRTVTLERQNVLAHLQASLAEVTGANAILQQFAHITSHDLQEPLRAVSGCAQLLQRKLAGTLDQQTGDLLRMMVEGSQRMKAMIADLLAFSSTHQNERLETVDANAALQQALAQLSCALEESAAEIQVGALPSLRFGKAPLVQVLQNLVGNAIKYRGTERLKIQVDAHRQDEAWVLSVADNGIGFEAQYAEHIFGLFKRLHTREVYAGTGVGLALAKRIVTLRGGKIWAESTPGRGSTFSFSVPDQEPERGPMDTSAGVWGVPSLPDVRAALLEPAPNAARRPDWASE